MGTQNGLPTWFVNVRGHTDKAEKKVAEGGENNTHNLLPDFFKKKIPIDPMVVNRARRKMMDNEWKLWVGETDQMEHMQYINGTYPSMMFSRVALNLHLSWQEYATLVQLRLRH